MDRRAEMNGLTPNNIDRPRLVAVASGKGGVGKSVIALNLADHLAQRAKVLLIDTDFLNGNLHLLINAAPVRGWQNICLGRAEIDGTLVNVNDNLHLLASSGLESDGSLPDAKRLASFLSSLRKTFYKYAYIVFDTASGILPHTSLILHSVDEVILVTTPELTAISDCYALYKMLLTGDNRISASLLVNREDRREEIEYIYRKFTVITNQFLGRTPAFLGALGFDRTLVEAVASQKAIADHAPQSRINSQFADLAKSFSDYRESASFPPERINSTALRADIKE